MPKIGLMTLLSIMALLSCTFALPQMPIRRPFIPIHHAGDGREVLADLRILQFNMLADGLSGLRADLGGFSKAKREDMDWSSRKIKLMYEILQYDPDVITLQECDHYYDFFLPELAKEGYDGMFAPKPASACLEVSDRSDGCAIFLKRDKIRAVSSEIWQNLRVQNQVALIAICEVLTKDGDVCTSVVVATTHLKAAKTADGELCRYGETQQLLSAIHNCSRKFWQYCRREGGGVGELPVVLTGDLNACPTHRSSQFGFNCTVYPLIKEHPMQLRSVMNDDLVMSPEGVLSSSVSAHSDTRVPSQSGSEGAKDTVWTTWKSRWKKGKENVVRHCIDYIMYSSGNVRAASAVDIFSDAQIAPELFPSSTYPSDHISLVADLQILGEQS
mmetsp:Transcript_7500/g.16412  ORF Transcript_7500/g.16412 Transcript_7500/m.16412 type:complete len:387 (+) Transcript_7500:301-1461(+)